VIVERVAFCHEKQVYMAFIDPYRRIRYGAVELHISDAGYREATL